MILHLYGLAARIACATSSTTARIAQAVRASWIGTVPGCLAVAEFGMENPRDLTAVMDATAEPTPEGDAAWREAVRRQCLIEIACEDWAAEVAACADAELIELLKGGRP